ncbi:MAG: dTDP-4-dehydrorhamnose reductase [Bacteroidales bacterium]|jgi:dTDP-4-dehydrorhamnose reductase|nr:dTDP-4-dehydrorhamnose reductase [Bacteroidales bacterium]
MSHLLITGANGQLGNELRKLAPAYAHHRFFFTDVAELDITNPNAIEAFFADNRIDAVVNCAAYTAVDKAESDEATALLINSTAVQYLAQSCSKHQATLVHVSTDYVYDGQVCTPYSENHPTAPLSAYGRTKLAGEKAALSAEKAVILRTAWLYSAFGNNFVKTMLRLGRERDKLNVVFDQTGAPTYAADLAQCIMQIVEKDAKGELVRGIFHFSDEGVCSWYDFAREIMQMAGLACVVHPIESKDYPTPAVRPSYSVLNKAAVKKAYGVTIPHWRESLGKCLTELAASQP